MENDPDSTRPQSSSSAAQSRILRLKEVCKVTGLDVPSYTSCRPNNIFLRASKSVYGLWEVRRRSTSMG